jgi:hypothetical protein
VEQLWRHGQVTLVSESVRDAANMVVYAEGLLQDDDGARRIGLS